MSSPALSVEQHLRNRVQAARAAYKAAFESKDYPAMAKESCEVNDSEVALERYLAKLDEAKPQPPVRRRA